MLRHLPFSNSIIGRMIFMKKTFVVIFMILLGVLVAAPAFAQTANGSAVFMIDTYLEQAGYQNDGFLVNGIGASQTVGFGIFVRNVNPVRSFNIDVTWDGNLADLSTKSATSIAADDVTINGNAITLGETANLLGDPTKGPGEVKETGHYYGAYAKFGGDEVVSVDYGLLYFFALKTKATFLTSDKLAVAVKTTIGWTTGGVGSRYLGQRYFYVNPGIVDVKNSSWGKIKSQFKDF